jgi:hypothetical protein
MRPLSLHYECQAFVRQRIDVSFSSFSWFHCVDLTSSVRKFFYKCNCFRTSLHKQLPSATDSDVFRKTLIKVKQLTFLEFRPKFIIAV